MNILLGIYPFVLALGASVAAAFLQRLITEYFPKHADTVDKHHDIEDKLAKAHAAMKEASEYMAGLQKGLEEQQQDLKVAESEYIKYRELAAAEKAKADAFLDALQQTISSGNKRERLWSFGIGLVANLLVFFLGVIFSDSVKAGWMAFTHGSK